MRFYPFVASLMLDLRDLCSLAIAYVTLLLISSPVFYKYGLIGIISCEKAAISFSTNKKRSRSYCTY
jgi:ABC-type polysaccharide/polyol phosphate export permease